MKLICVDSKGTEYYSPPLVKGQIYEGYLAYSDDRWIIDGHYGKIYYNSRFKKYKEPLNNNTITI